MPSINQISRPESRGEIELANNNQRRDIISQPNQGVEGTGSIVLSRSSLVRSKFQLIATLLALFVSRPSHALEEDSY